MRLLRNVVLMVFPILLMINVYRFVSYGDSYSFHGVSYLYNYLHTFNGFNTTLDVLYEIEVAKVTADNIVVVDLVTFFAAFVEYFKMIGLAITIPFDILIDIVLDVLWVLRMFAEV